MSNNRYQFIFFISVILFPTTRITPLSNEQQLADGLTYKHVNSQTPYNLSMHILEVDPSKLSITAQAASNKCVSKAKTSSIAQESNGLAAINGGYSSSAGIPAHHLKIDGQWFTASRHNRAALGWSSDASTVLIDTITTTWALSTSNKTFPIDALNQAYSPQRCTLYSHHFDKTLSCHKESTVITIINNSIVSIDTGLSSATIPRNGYVYVIGHEASVDTSQLKPSTPVTITTTITCSDATKQTAWENIDYLINGTPHLVKDGQKITNFSAENISPGFIEAQHPRTAVGILPNNNWLLVVIDARNTNQGVGVSLHELADIMLELGCTDALNLCGGRSSTMYVNGKTVTQSNAAHSFLLELFDFGMLLGEKRVSDAIVIKKKNN